MQTLDHLYQTGLDDGSGLPLADPTTKALYRAKLRQLEQDIDRCTLLGDQTGRERAESEKTVIVKRLSSSFDRYGRPRLVGGTNERARVKVTRQIRAVVACLKEEDPALGEHLERYVHTGAYCSYRPPQPLQWSL
jgi:hypothetical protein